MNLGIVCASMSRAAGGVFFSVCQLAQQLEVCEVQSEVFAGRDSFSDADLAAWGAVPVRIHRVFGPAAFGYQPALRRSLHRATSDILHLHGLWMYPSIALGTAPLCKRPRVVSPHGMLDPWALRNSSWKKHVAWTLYEASNLAGASCIHALCSAELHAIRHCGVTGPVAVIPNGVDLSIADGDHIAPAWLENIPDGAKILLYLGRIHPKKGLLPLLEAINKLSCDKDFEIWHLVIAGWDQGEHLAEVKAKAMTLNLFEKVHFVGPVFGRDKDRKSVV